MLTKFKASVYVPEIVGQPALAASDNCYPPPPLAPPVNNPPPPDDGGSGPGSGGGCQLVPVYVTFISCGGYPESDPQATFPCEQIELPIGFVTVCP